MSDKKIMKKENIKPVLVLFVICLAVAVLMGVVNMFTAPKIAADKEAAINDTLKVVLPEGTTFEKMDLGEDYPDEIDSAYKSDGGYVFELTVKGKDFLTVMCGVDNEGKIVGIEIVSEAETPGYKEKVLPLVTGEDGKYNGKTGETIQPELVSGATLTSTAMYNAAKASLNGYAVATGGEVDNTPEEPVTPVDTVTPVIDRTEDEKLTLAKSMYSGEVSLESVYLYKPDPTTIGAWKNSADNTYVLHIGTRTQYVKLATEAMVKTDSEGTVLDIKLLNWIVGHGVNYTPEYLNSFIGKNKYSTDEVELVTEATGTSSDLVNALEKALYNAFGSVAMSSSDIEKYAAKAVPRGEELEAMALPENAPDTVKAMFKLKSGRGYVFYTVTSTEYVKYETEAFIFSDINGKVINVYLANWTVGHGVYPSQQFIDSFNGKTENTVGDVEAVSAATGTSDHLKGAVADALSLVPDHFNYSVLAEVILAVAFLSITGVVVFYKVKRRGNIKNEKQ